MRAVTFLLIVGAAIIAVSSLQNANKLTAQKIEKMLNQLQQQQQSDGDGGDGAMVAEDEDGGDMMKQFLSLAKLQQEEGGDGAPEGEMMENALVAGEEDEGDDSNGGAKAQWFRRAVRRFTRRRVCRKVCHYIG